MGRSPARPNTFAVSGHEHATAPGQYDDGVRFNTGVKSFTIGEKREQPIPKTAGPGSYNPEQAEALTKTRAHNIDLGKSPSRPNTFAVAGHEHAAAPGQYDDGVRFNSGVKSFTIGEKREQPIPKTAGPGEYQVDKALNQTHTRNPAPDMSSSPPRPGTFAIAGQSAPGQYDSSVKFANDVNGFTIGVKREQPIPKTVGPGEYAVDRAEKLTRAESPAVQFGESPERNTFAISAMRRAQEVNTQVREERKTTTKVKKSTKKEPKQGIIKSSVTSKHHQTAMYSSLKPRATIPNEPVRQSNLDVSRASAASSRKSGKSGSAVKTSMRKTTTVKKTTMKSSSKVERLNNFAQDTDTAPGQYDVRGQNFGETTKSFTIGQRREQNQEMSPGPGSYSPERSDSQTKTRTSAVDFSKTTIRREVKVESQPGPGDVEKERFYNYPKEQPVYSIPEKREVPI